MRGAKQPSYSELLLRSKLHFVGTCSLREWVLAALMTYIEVVKWKRNIYACIKFNEREVKINANLIYLLLDILWTDGFKKIFSLSARTGFQNNMLTRQGENTLVCRVLYNQKCIPISFRCWIFNGKLRKTFYYTGDYHLTNTIYNFEIGFMGSLTMYSICC